MTDRTVKVRFWAKMIVRSTDIGEIMDRPSMGRTVVIDVIEICRFKAGKMVEHWRVPDQLGMLHKLGLVPK